jgi:phage major head subunit gpT-like protein
MGYAVLDDYNIRREFYKAYSAAEAGSWATKLSMQFDSDRLTEEYKWLGGAPLMREWLGGRLEKGIRDEAYEIRNIKYEATIPIFNDDRRRDKTGQLMRRVGEMAERAATHWDSLLNTLIESTTALCYDGQLFFDTDHVSGDSGTLNNNVLDTVVTSLSVVLETAPTATEFATALLDIIAHMYTFKDDVGEPINQNATNFALMVPVSLMGPALQATTKAFLTNGVSNPFLGTGFNVSVIPNPRSAWTKEFALFRLDGQMAPFIMQSEYGIQTGLLGAGSDEDFKNDRQLFGIHASRNVGYGFWQYACKATFDTT